MRISGPKRNLSAIRPKSVRPDQCFSVISKRWLRVSTSGSESFDLHPAKASTASIPDARFEIAGGSFPLLSVSLPASQDLCTRSGTLVGIAGKAENTFSTLSLLEPFTRTVLRIPFLYRIITSTTPVTALISTRGFNTSITAIQLDGTTDWMLARQSLLAWTGRALTVRPKANLKMNVTHWGSSEVTGRGLLALIGQGSVSEIDLKAGESYVVHPSNVIAYSINSHRPLPYRLKSSSFGLQAPKLDRWPLADTKFLRNLTGSTIWRVISRIFLTIRTWLRKTIWGDRLFLQFHGPTTILLQTRASRIRDLLTASDVNEMADVEHRVIEDFIPLGKLQNKTMSAEKTLSKTKPAITKIPTMQRASIEKDGRVLFESIDELAPLR